MVEPRWSQSCSIDRHGNYTVKYVTIVNVDSETLHFQMASIDHLLV